MSTTLGNRDIPSGLRDKMEFEVVTTFSSFRFPETKSAHLKFSLLSFLSMKSGM